MDKVFIAKDKCGCIIAAASTDKRYRTTVGEDLWDWMTGGCQVEIANEPVSVGCGCKEDKDGE